MILVQHLDVEDVSIDLKLSVSGLTDERCNQLHRFLDVIVDALEKEVGTECIWLDSCSANIDLFGMLKRS